ncbi:MAG TPA: acyl-CoA thioesterase [Phycisphaerales bacterium]|nr:acyl-CoA thioesterase [Phycisphaerales bacterium]
MMPRDTNPQGTIFGGVILSLIDQAAWIEALRQCNRRYVTVAMDSVEFHHPVLVGDILSLWATTERVGRTSMRVKVEVRAMRPDAGTDISVTTAFVVFVAVDEQGRPTPIAP